MKQQINLIASAHTRSIVKMLPASTQLLARECADVECNLVMSINLLEFFIKKKKFRVDFGFLVIGVFFLNVVGKSFVCEQCLSFLRRGLALYFHM